jgi:NitT/TauT family transport system substrate-binding protein
MRSPRLTPVATVAILGVLTMTLASACTSSPAPSASTASKLEKTDLVVGALPAESMTALYIAEQRGIFKAHGLHVTIKTIVSTTDVVPDLLHGSMDIAGGQITTFIAAQAKGLGTFRILASGLALAPHVNEIMVKPSSGITSPVDLKGKTIAVNALTGDGVLLTDALLDDYNLSPSDVKFVNIPFTSMQNALGAGDVDAAYVTEPYATEMEQNLGATALADLDQGAGQGLLIGGFTATSAWVAKYPHTAAAFTASIEQASSIADSDLTADQKAFMTYLKTPEQVATVMAVGTFPTSVSEAQLTQVVDLMSEFGEIKPGFPVQKLT